MLCRVSYCRGRRPGILDGVHALRPARSEVVVKLCARRVPSLTQLHGRDTHALCGPCVTQSRVSTHRSGAQYPRDALFKGRNIQDLSDGNTSVGDTSTKFHWGRGGGGGARHRICPVHVKERKNNSLPSSP
jgi:hypothetical protein